ncbi:hypothetical protein DEHRE_00515 [Dehalobacter restrictus DSM 9455]|uniref:Uncharacterized protein n=1 Tax=Dehalobacter restrictus (strain DSM 9455 / PER-K23) TaxID=871738 RepID=A0ABM5P8W0_DEHRP|nr:hypothetical protein DEHRE_00515 [Dehalobacter restrictus DSM 9455]
MHVDKNQQNPYRIRFPENFFLFTRKVEHSKKITKKLIQNLFWIELG